MKSTATFLILSLSLLTACGGPPEEKQQTASAGLFLEDSQYGVVHGGVFSKWFADGIQGAVVELGPYVDTTGFDGLFEFREIPFGSYRVVVSAEKFQSVTIDSFEIPSPYPKKLHIAMQLSMDYIRGDETLSQIYDNGAAKAQEAFEQGKVMIRGSQNWPIERRYNLYVDTIDTWLPMTGEEPPHVAGDMDRTGISGFNCHLIRLDSLGLLSGLEYKGRDLVMGSAPAEDHWKYTAELRASSFPFVSPDSVWILTLIGNSIWVESADTAYMVPGAFAEHRSAKRGVLGNYPATRWVWGAPGSNTALWIEKDEERFSHGIRKKYDLRTGHVIREWPAHR